MIITDLPYDLTFDDFEKLLNKYLESGYIKDWTLQRNADPHRAGSWNRCHHARNQPLAQAFLHLPLCHDHVAHGNRSL